MPREVSAARFYLGTRFCVRMGCTRQSVAMCDRHTRPSTEETFVTAKVLFTKAQKVYGGATRLDAKHTAPSYHDTTLNAVSKVTRRDASAPVNISHKHPVNFYIHEPSECQHTGLRVQNMNTEIGNFAPQIHRTNARQI